MADIVPGSPQPNNNKDENTSVNIQDIYATLVNPVFLDTLTNMGFPQQKAIQALFETGNSSPEAAANWLIQPENGDRSPEEDVQKGIAAKLVPKSKSNRAKMVLVVRQDLKMGVGKIAAQCSHATLGLYKTMVKTHPSLLHTWEHLGACAKIVVKCKDENELLMLEQRAEEFQLPTHVVMDAGKTQIASGSLTVLAICGPQETMDSVTGHLKLM